MDAFSLFLVAGTTVLAALTDLKYRVIYRRLTLPVFLTGLAYSILPFVEFLKDLPLNGAGVYVFLNILWCWLGPSLVIFCYSLLLFWLGILDAGDGHFLTAITPWCGMDYMMRIILLFYPLAIIFLVVYLLHKYNYDWKQFISHQVKDSILLLSSLPAIINNIKRKEGLILVKNIPYATAGIATPPGMIPLGLAVMLVICERVGSI